MEEAITALLLENDALTALVGTRITWLVREQGAAVPAVVLNRVAGVRSYNMQGPVGLVMSRLQADTYAHGYKEATYASRALRAALDGYSGGDIQSIFVVNERQSYESGQDAAERFCRVMLDFEIYHAE